MFGYDHVNYARYLTAILGDMLRLLEDFLDVYEEFLNGNFVTQLTSGSKFSRVEMDKVIEMSLFRLDHLQNSYFRENYFLVF